MTWNCVWEKRSASQKAAFLSTVHPSPWQHPDFWRNSPEFKWKHCCASCIKLSEHEARPTPWLKENIKGSCRLQSGKWHEAVFVSDNPSLLLNFYQRPTFPGRASLRPRLDNVCEAVFCVSSSSVWIINPECFWGQIFGAITFPEYLDKHSAAKVFEFSSRSTLNFSFRVNWITFGRKDASLKTCESKSEWKWAKFASKKEINEASEKTRRASDILQARSGRIRINHLFMCSCLLPREMNIQRRR